MNAQRPILQVVSSLGVGGAERVALELAAGMRARGLGGELFVVSPREQGRGDHFAEPLRAEAARRAVPVRDFILKSIRDAEGRARLVRHLKETAALIHVHNRPQDWQLLTLARVAGLPALYTRHLPYAGLSARQRVVYFAAARTAAAVVAVSKTVERHLYKEERAPRRKVRLIYNGIDTARFAPKPEETRRKLRRQLALADDDFAWLCAARLAPQKGQRFLITALSLLPAQSKAVLVLAGDGPEREALENLALERNITMRVRFLGARDDVPDLLAAADGYACASLAEGHPLSLLEALSAAVPAVAPRLDSIEELPLTKGPVLFGPKHAGWAERHEPREIADALLRIERDAARARAQAALAREEIVGRFGLARMLDAHETLYREILK